MYRTSELTCRPYNFRARIEFYENRHSFPGQVERFVMGWGYFE